MLYNAKAIPADVSKQLEELDKCALELLQQSKKYGKVYIVTNAAQGWVEMSAGKFMPLVSKELENITVISARSRYEHLYPKNYQKWKIEAFMETKKEMSEHAITNLIALGDNMFEIEAAHILGAQFKNAFIKTVKFRQSPRPEELIKQIKLVSGQFELICTSAKNLTVRLLKQSKEEEEREKQMAINGQLDEASVASNAVMQKLKK